MELKYIWVEEYKNLKKLGFNFNNSSNSKFDYKNEQIEISISSDNNTPDNFFGKKILGITGIVGENGSGKTNLAEFINYNLAHVTDNSHAFSGIIGKGILIIDKWIFFHRSLKISNLKALEKEGYKGLEYDKAPLDSGRGELKWNSMERNRYIYYNPTFDFRYINIRSNLLNISTGYLAFNDVHYGLYHRQGIDDYNKGKVTDSLKAHYIEEKIREANFILNFNQETEELLKIKSNEFYLTLDFEDKNRLVKNPLDNISSIKKDSYRLINEIEREILSQDYFDKFKISPTISTGYTHYKFSIDFRKEQFKKLFLLQFFKILLIDNVFDTNFIHSFIYNIDYIEKNILYIKVQNLKNLLNKLINQSSKEETSNKIENFNLFEFQKREKSLFSFFSTVKLNVDTENKINVIKKIIFLSNELTDYRLHFHYSFYHRLSTGQQNLMNFYSRLFYAKQQIDIKDNNRFKSTSEQIILLVDEGEVNFHPEWQRKFLNNTLKMIKRIFVDLKIQLILTTHSPFVLSDLPKQNVIFLTKDEKGEAKKSLLIRSNTFGANIHTLLSNNFFMKDTLGEFASEKIKEIVNFYYELVDNQSENLSKQFYEDYKHNKRNRFHFITENIGDDVIKGILENHIEFIENKLFNKSYKEIRIEKLKKEIEKLEGYDD